MWLCHVICRAWRLAHSSTRVWKEWHCQAVLRAWHLGTTSTRAWKKWRCQAIYEALDLALDFERVCSMWHYQVVFGPCRYAALTIPTAVCWSALCENPGSEKVTVIWLIHWNWGKPIFRHTHVFQIAMSVTHRNGCNWTEKSDFDPMFFLANQVWNHQMWGYNGNRINIKIYSTVIWVVQNTSDRWI